MITLAPALFRQETVIERVEGMRPYTPLELAGFNIYIREGCYNCHSQQIEFIWQKTMGNSTFGYLGVMEVW